MTNNMSEHYFLVKQQISLLPSLFSKNLSVVKSKPLLA
jgi:hypothetical protein